MAEPSLATIQDEHDLYPVHEEDTVPEIPAHYRQSRYMSGAVEAERGDLWVAGEICLYWERGKYDRYAAPDVTVVDCPPEAGPRRVYLKWVDPPLLFVAEVGSRSTFREDTGPKLEVFARHLEVPEYLYADPPRGDLRFWRLVDGEYSPVLPDADGRYWSEGLDLGFGFDPLGFLRVYTRDGRIVATHAEEVRERREAERAQAEAERRAEGEARRRVKAERERREAEHRADAEARERAELERRLAEARAELERLRRGNGDRS